MFDFFSDSNNNFSDGLSFETGKGEDKILKDTLELIKRFTGKDAKYQIDDSIPDGQYRIFSMIYSPSNADEDDNNQYTDNVKGGYQISIPDINKKTSIERAMSEILYGSDYQNAKAWASQEAEKLHNADWKNQSYEINLEGYETLNKIRCQHAIGKQYIGTGDRIEDENNKLQNSQKVDAILNPVEALKARHLGVDLSENKYFDNETFDYYINKSKGLSKIGLAKLSKSFYNKVVAPWLLAQLQNIKPEEQPQTPEPESNQDGDQDQDGNEEVGSEEPETIDGNEWSENGQDGDEDSDMESEAGLNDNGDDIDEGQGISEDMMEARDALESIRETVDTQTMRSNSGYDPDYSYQWDKDIEDLTTDIGDGSSQSTHEGSLRWNELENEVSEEDFQDGDEEFKKIEEIIFDKDYDPNQTKSVSYVKDVLPSINKVDVSHGREKYPVNNMLVRHISKTFEKLMASVGEDNSPEGSELDINAFMDSKIDKRPDVFIQEEETNAWKGIIAIDLSGSMNDGKLDTCKQICANILEATKNIPRVEVKIIGWSGHDKNCSIVEATTREELNEFRAGSLTPMAKGMLYSKHELEKMQGTRKVMFFLTDGYPNDNGDVAVVKQAVNEMRSKKYSVLGIGIGMDKQSCDSEGIFPNMFGKGFVACQTTQEVEKVLRNDFIREVSKFLRR